MDLKQVQTLCETHQGVEGTGGLSVAENGRYEVITGLSRMFFITAVRKKQRAE